MGLFGWLKKAPEIKKAEFVSPATGKIIPVDQVEDETFASKILGDGFAVELTDGEVIAPFDGEVTDGFAVEPANGNIVSPVTGTVSSIFPTKHALGLVTDSGLEVLVHIGLDTVELNGSGFDVKVKQGDQVKQGQVLVKVDLDQVTGAGKSLVSPVVFSSGAMFTLLEKEFAVKGEEILRLEQ